ncbi:hypothetical protein FQA39_LY05727 [Lamprigera yunnana]|nr:hypothetical protein FQA39_LY05727 [Lamprigera yunnana]
MDVDYNESLQIKSEVIVEEHFSFEDYGNGELKMEPIEFEESLKCEEEAHLIEHSDIHDVPIHQYMCNECHFITTKKDSLTEHLKVTKNIQYSCKECKFKTLLGCSIKQHLGIHTVWVITYY